MSTESVESVSIDPENFVDFLAFDLANRRYAIEVGRVRHVQRHPTVTRVPRAPAVIGGVTAVDGELTIAVDLAAVLDGAGASVTGSDRALVVLEQEVTPDTVGLLVQTVDGIDRRAVEGVTPVGGKGGSDEGGNGGISDDEADNGGIGIGEEDEETDARWFRAVLQPTRTDEAPVPVLDVNQIVSEVAARC